MRRYSTMSRPCAVNAQITATLIAMIVIDQTGYQGIHATAALLRFSDMLCLAPSRPYTALRGSTPIDRAEPDQNIARIM
jgi:hypothetical protein